jgi:diacylglycerol O-acyltransferase / wax synthase
VTELHFDTRMSDTEALMWRLDRDPHLSSTYASVTILDTAPDMARLMRRMERAVTVIPRLRQRVQSVPGNLAPPQWIDDVDFDLSFHVRRLALPKPGTDRQLMDLVSILVADPFDRIRPLWTFFVIEGLRGRRAALVQKLHHTITDGEGGVQLSLQFLDFERDAPEPPPVEAPPQQSASHQDPVDPVREIAGAALRMPLGMLGQMKGLAADPSQLGKTVGTMRGLAQQLGDTERAHSPLWTSRTLRRRMETLQAPFREAKTAAKALGGTLNTLFLTAAADAAGTYHREMGAPVEALRASMAISTRTGDESNAFTLARMLVPTDEMDIADRFEEVHRITTEVAMASKSGGAGLAALATLTAALPTGVIARIARQQAQTVDFATSNVKGSPIPVYVAGAQFLATYPVGPLGGVAFNLTLLSYAGSLDMGVNLDPGAVEEPERLVRALERSFAQLCALGG